jgi:hypothetical protein
LSYLLKYIGEVKSEIRIRHAQALQGGNKKKGKGNQPVEKVSIENCVIFVSDSFPEYKLKVVQILQGMEFKDG